MNLSSRVRLLSSVASHFVSLCLTSLNLSLPVIIVFKMYNSSTYHVRLLWGLNELIHIKHLECLVKVSLKKCHYQYSLLTIIHPTLSSNFISCGMNLKLYVNQLEIPWKDSTVHNLTHSTHALKIIEQFSTLVQ